MTDTRADSPISRRRRNGSGRGRLWENISEKVTVAVATALATGLITVAGPPFSDWLFSVINKTDGVTPSEVAFQKEKWVSNANCANSQPVWHEMTKGQKIDATICPGTGDILLVVKDFSGRQVQWWSDNRNLMERFSGNLDIADKFFDIVSSPAYAATVVGKPLANQQLAQSVICQIMLPDNRGLRRRLVVGPNQCIEIIIDTWTGAVISQRPVPCVPNCAVNV